jgi:hypothetical protein
MILEMPDRHKDDPFKSWEKLAHYIEDEGLHLRFITATHDHGDHFDTYPQFHQQFRKVPIVVNDIFLTRRGVKPSHTIKPKDLQSIDTVKPSMTSKGVPLYCYHETFETDLAGEPVYLVHAPKHSLTDQMTIFRGCMITGDWWLGPGDPNKNRVPIPTIHQSIDRIKSFLKQHHYTVHSLFSVHANEFRRDVDLDQLLEETRPIE